MRQLAEGRANAVRDFLVLQGAVEATRVSAAAGDVYAAPRQKGEKQARVEFARATD
jgi:outer membrane protein OmpA-like peptidoglycan-associated protein